MTASLDVIERELALLTVDIKGFTRAATGTRALDLAIFLDTYYRLCALVVTRHHGRIVKFMGDHCFAVFGHDHCVDAVDSALELQREVALLRGIFASRPPAIGANVHLATVADGEIGPEHDRRYDVFGEGVNHLFRMGGGVGIRISEPVYRALPNARRGPWAKNQPPATYVLESRS